MYETIFVLIRFISFTWGKKRSNSTLSSCMRDLNETGKQIIITFEAVTNSASSGLGLRSNQICIFLPRKFPCIFPIIYVCYLFSYAWDLTYGKCPHQICRSPPPVICLEFGVSGGINRSFPPMLYMILIFSQIDACFLIMYSTIVFQTKSFGYAFCIEGPQKGNRAQGGVCLF